MTPKARHGARRHYAKEVGLVAVGHTRLAVRRGAQHVRFRGRGEQHVRFRDGAADTDLEERDFLGVDGSRTPSSVREDLRELLAVFLRKHAFVEIKPRG